MPGKSPQSWKWSLLVKPSGDHLTAPQGNENFSLDLLLWLILKLNGSGAVSGDFGNVAILLTKKYFWKLMTYFMLLLINVKG